MTSPYLHVLVPSRGRPQAVLEMVRAFDRTCTAADQFMHTTALTFVVDSDDPSLRAYQVAVDFARHRRMSYHAAGSDGGIVKPEIDIYIIYPAVTLLSDVGRCMGTALNTAAAWYANGEQPPFAIGFMGDDHRPRTPAFDQAYLDVLTELGTGIVYGDDRLQGPNLPTQVAMTSDIIRKLGYMSPPDQKHMYLDNFWLELGRGADCIRYLSDVIIEHMHPVAGKAEWDENYLRVDGHTDHDRQAWEKYRTHQLPRDIAAVRSLRENR